MSDFVFVPLRSFFSATLAKRWKVQFRQGFAQFNNVDQKETRSNNDIAIYIYMFVGCVVLVINKSTTNIYVYIYIRHNT